MVEYTLDGNHRLASIIRKASYWISRHIPESIGLFRNFVIMRALILSDIHANLEALEAVIYDAQDRGGFDVVWCLGDTVGYGPDPGPCIDRIREFNLVAVAGNHDHAAIGLFEVSDFNDAAKTATTWTSEQLRAEHRVFLASPPFVCIELYVSKVL